MCGIVGIIRKTNLTLNDVNAFNDMLFMDTLRGWDSTGVAAIHTHQSDATVYKRAVPGPDFIQLRAYKKMVNTPTQLRGLLGHNRAATRGAVNDENAHPFQRAGVTLVHNGSLDYYTNLVPQDTVSVDSEAICHAISASSTQDALIETIEKIKGAFSLVWHDSATDMLYFIRNEDRPMYYATLFTKNKEYDGIIWASEPSTILAAAQRNGLHINDPVSTDVGKLTGLSLAQELVVTVRQEVAVYEKKPYAMGTYYDSAAGNGRSSYRTYSGGTTQNTLDSSQKGGAGSSQSSSQQTHAGQSCNSSQKQTGNESPTNSATLASRKGFYSAPECGDYIDVLISDTSFVKYNSSRGGFRAGQAACFVSTDAYLNYPVVVHSTPDDRKIDGVYRCRVIGKGPRNDHINGVKDAAIVIYCTFNGSVYQQDGKVYGYVRRLPEAQRTSLRRPPNSTEVALYRGEVDIRAEYTSQSNKGTEELLALPAAASAVQDTNAEAIDPDEVAVVGPNGEAITLGEFDRLTPDGCAMCSGDLDPMEVGNEHWIPVNTGTACLCPMCLNEYEAYNSIVEKEQKH